jgi:fructosamine-3-kinase
MSGLAEQAAKLLNGVLVRSEPVAGGDLSPTCRIWLRDGRTAIVKGGTAPRTEADMLASLAEVGAPTPAVLAVSDSALVLEALPNDGGMGPAWADLGTVLRRVHAEHGAGYGWDTDYAFGDVAIENSWHDDWPGFWAARRLRVNVPFLPSGLARRVEILAADLPNRLPARPRPSLLHGDLWGGNVLAAGARITGLIDPACYYGDGEVDIAMLGLFDRPSPAFFAAYGGLAPGSEQRLAIYRLWPALVHVRLFGSGYHSMADSLLRDVGI